MNYYCFYVAAEFLPSGVLSVIFATAAIMGAFNQRLFFGKALSVRVLLGAVLGVVGLLLLTWGSVSVAGTAEIGVLLVLPFLGTYLFSLGNIVSARLSQDEDLPNVIAHGMVYGTISSALRSAWPSGCRFQFRKIPMSGITWDRLPIWRPFATVVGFRSLFGAGQSRRGRRGLRMRRCCFQSLLWWYPPGLRGFNGLASPGWGRLGAWRNSSRLFQTKDSVTSQPDRQRIPSVRGA